MRRRRVQASSAWMALLASRFPELALRASAAKAVLPRLAAADRRRFRTEGDDMDIPAQPGARPPTTRATTRWWRATPGRGPTTRRPTGSPAPARRRDDDSPIAQDADADVVIVGSGFTGLATRCSSPARHGIKATVLEANHAVWGCTSRNGGQGRTPAGGCTARSGSRAGARRPRSSSTPRSAAASRRSRPGRRDSPSASRSRRLSAHRAPREEDGVPAQRGEGDARGVRLRHAHAPPDEVRSRT